MILQRLQLISAAALLAAGTAHAQTLSITEVCDGTVAAGLPKWAELTNVGTTTIPDLSVYSIGNFNNGASTLGFAATQLNAVSLAPGASYVFAYESATSTACGGPCFDTVYGFAADQYSGPFINGDDAIALFNGVAPAGTLGTDPSLFDVYGVIGCDPNATGTTCPEWEYTDSYAARCVSGPAITFAAADWNIPGPDALEGTGTCDPTCQHLAQTDPGNFAGCPTPTMGFCTAKTMVFCATPALISATGTSSATATSGFNVNAAPVRGCRSGILLYSNQPIVPGVAFGGPGDGLLCLTPTGLRRAAPIDSGGTASACDGTFSIDVNAFAQSVWVSTGCNPAAGQTNPAGFLTTAGTMVNSQMWGRDSVATGQVLSDGVSWTIGP